MKLLKKLVPAICTVGATLTVVPTIASCGDHVNIKIDENEKTKYGTILKREKLNPSQYKKTSCDATYMFELDDDIDDDDEIVVDSISSESTSFKAVEKTDCKVGWMDEFIFVSINFKSINDKQLSVGCKVTFKIVLKSKKGEVKKTTFDGLSLTMIDAPCDVVDSSIIDGLNGTADPATSAAAVGGFQIDTPSFIGSITLLTSQMFTSSDSKSTLTFATGMSVEPKEFGDAGVAINAGFVWSSLDTPTGTANFTIEEGSQMSFLFSPLDSQILPYISTIDIYKDVGITLNL